MNLRERLHTTGKNVGKKEGDKEKQLQSYILIDSCDKCPLSVYVDVVCRDNLKALLIEGDVPTDVLEKTKTGLIVEFSELSGNTQSKMMSNSLRQMYLYKSQIQGLQICINLIACGSMDAVSDYLKQIGIRIDLSNAPKAIKRIESIAKSKIIQFKEAYKRYTSLVGDVADSSPSVQMFIDQLVILSKYVGFNLSINNITLAEYASYLKNYKENGGNK